jgi:hypothetical protein
MTMPGFKAEASAYRANGYYRAASIRSATSGSSESVRLAVGQTNPNCFSDCMSWCDPAWAHPSCPAYCRCTCFGGHHCTAG